MQVLVTGGAGFIGSHLVRALLQAGHRVRVVDDLSSGESSRLANLPIDFLQTDLCHPTTLQRALEGVEIVFHLAGPPILTTPRASPVEILRRQTVLLDGTLQLLHRAAAAKVLRLVLLGSGSVYGRSSTYLLHEEVPPAPTTFDGAQRLVVEHYARLFWEHSHLPTIVLRCFDVFGPGQRHDLVPALCRAVLGGSTPLIHGHPKEVRDLVHVDNVVAALIAAGRAPHIEGSVFNIASGEAIQLPALWRLICTIAGTAPVEPSYAPPSSLEIAVARVSIARAVRALGFVPSVRLREGLRRTLDWHRAQLSSDASWFSPPAAPRSVRPPPLPSATRGIRRRETELPIDDTFEITELTPLGPRLR